MTDSGPFTITLYNKEDYTYPTFAKVIGWILAISSVSCVPIVAIKTLLSLKGTLGQVSSSQIFKYSSRSIRILFQRLLLSITPEKEQKDIIEGKPGTRATLDHWISL